jgi:hypothetical protein
VAGILKEEKDEPTYPPKGRNLPEGDERKTRSTRDEPSQNHRGKEVEENEIDKGESRLSRRR